MTKKKFRFIALLVLVIIVVALGIGGVFLYPYVRGAWVAVRKPTTDIATLFPSSATSSASVSSTAPLSGTTSSGLSVAPGFTFSLLTKNVPGARVIAQDELGNLWVSQTSLGRITRIELQNGEVVGQEIALKGLNKPHGLAFDPADPAVLYIATEKELLRYRVYTPGSVPEKVLDVPTGGRHTTRTLLFRRDGFLYISIGSTCDSCQEKTAFVAGISRVNVHDKKPTLVSYATGLRNSVFMTENPLTHDLVATEMGRDFLGDHLPPDEINIIREGGNYGWPRCYGANIHDTVFDDQAVSPCQEPFALPSFIDIPAHSAPLGLAYIPASWNQAWQGNLIVALHGSWNSTQPVGYKLVRLNVDPEGRYYGSEDVVTGWLQKNETLGRPVDVMVDQSGGQMYISDDVAGVIYVLRPAAAL